MSESNLINVTGLWEKRSDKTGETYFQGKMGNVSVMIFRNTKKRNSKDPDWNMTFGKYVSKKPENYTGAVFSNGTKENLPKSSLNNVSFDDDDISF